MKGIILMGKRATKLYPVTKKSLKTVFFCGHHSPYGIAHLQPLLESEIRIVAVILAPYERWKIFQKKLLGEDISKESALIGRIKAVYTWWIFFCDSHNASKLARQYRIPVVYIHDVNSSQGLSVLRQFGAELFICSAYPQIFSKELLSIPPKGAINSHPALLPKYRGANPHFWTILNGETRTGLTAHYMTERIDDGDVLAQAPFNLEDDETYSSLYKKLVEHVPVLVNQLQEVLLMHEGRAVPQDHNQATFYKNDKDNDHRICWSGLNYKRIHNLVRTGKAFCFFRYKRVRIRKISLLNNADLGSSTDTCVSGTILRFDSRGIVVKVNDGYVCIHQLQLCFIDFRADIFAMIFRLKNGEMFK